MSDLSRSLIDAAAPHVWRVTDAETPEQVDGHARAVVVAVLETLADEELRRYMARETLLDLRGLASEVREGT